MLAFIQMHWEAISEFGLFASFAAASSMPKKIPLTPQELWDWLFNFVQELISMRSAKMAVGAEPQVKASIPLSTLPEVPKP